MTIGDVIYSHLIYFFIYYRLQLYASINLGNPDNVSFGKDCPSILFPSLFDLELVFDWKIALLGFLFSLKIWWLGILGERSQICNFLSDVQRTFRNWFLILFLDVSH